MVSDPHLFFFPFHLLFPVFSFCICEFVSLVPASSPVFCLPFAGYRKQTSGDGAESSCEQCPVGKYGSDGLKCYFCPLGSYGPTVAAKECVSCSKEVGCGTVPGASVKAAVIDLPNWVEAVAADRSGTDSSTSALGTAGTVSSTNAPNVAELQLGESVIELETLNYLLQASMYPPLGVICLSLLIFHRHFSTRCCFIDEFAVQHDIMDTHAVRKVKSRFGGAFTWMLICLMVVLVTNSILERGHTITSTDSAERTTMLQDLVAKAEASGETGFGTLRVELEAFAVLSQAELDKKCQQITLLNATQSSSLYTCSITKVMASTCNVTLNCETTFNLRGDFVLALEMPTEFQTLAWTVNAKTWEFFEQARGDDQWLRYQTSVNHTTVAPKGNLLSGSALNPTRAMFGLTRGFADGTNVPADKCSSGLQLSFTQTDTVTEPVDVFANSEHVVEFNFAVLPALHVEVVEEKLSNIQLLASIFSLLGAAKKILSILKKKIAKRIDAYLSKRDKVPHDVKRRMELLHEDNLLHKRFRKLMDHHGIESSHNLKEISQVIVPETKGQPSTDFAFQSRRRSQVIEMTDMGVVANKEPGAEEKAHLFPGQIVASDDSDSADIAVDVVGLADEAASGDTKNGENEKEEELQLPVLTLQMRVDDLEKENDELITKLGHALGTQKLLLERLDKLEESVQEIAANEF